MATNTSGNQLATSTRSPNGTSGQQTTISPEEPFDPVAYEAGAIIGVVFGVVVSLIFVAIALVLYIRKKRERDRDCMRSNKVQRQSARSAGVYRDTTTEDRLVVTTNPGRGQGAEYKSLHKHGYEDESDEEL